MSINEIEEKWNVLRRFILNAIGNVLSPPDSFVLKVASHEFSVTHRLAMHLEIGLKSAAKLGQRHVDCDYNRVSDTMQDKLFRNGYLENALDKLEVLLTSSYKRLFPESAPLEHNIGAVKRALPNVDLRARPDIIVHSRGDDDENSLVLELKIHGNNGTPGALLDCARLLVFTSEHEQLPLYELGLFLDLRWNTLKAAFTKTAILFSSLTLFELDPNELSIISRYKL